MLRMLCVLFLTNFFAFYAYSEFLQSLRSMVSEIVVCHLAAVLWIWQKFWRRRANSPMLVASPRRLKLLAKLEARRIRNDSESPT